MNNSIYVTGHRHPDSDSICAAITYANLLQLKGMNGVAVRQGPLNEETKFILKKFHQENPLLLTDARTVLSDLDLEKPSLIYRKDSVHHAWHVMIDNHTKSLFVVDENNKLCGICTTSDLMSYRFQEDRNIAALMRKASLDTIARTVGGKVVLRPKHFEITGIAHVISSVGAELNFADEIPGGTVILASSELRQLKLLSIGCKLMILTCGVKASDNVLKLAGEIGCAVIETDENTIHTAQVVNESYPLEEIMSHSVVTFRDTEVLSDVAAKMRNNRSRVYPVINEAGDIVGAISRYHTIDYTKRRYALVDHSAVNQSIPHIMEEDLYAIVDHHHIGDITTDHPIEYRNVVCGCTNTIIAGLYEENGFVPSPDMAGLMLSAIISDTLNLKSATTTNLDRMTVKKLAAIAGVENVDEYAREMLGASVNLVNADPKDILYRDLKVYEIGKYHIGIGQTNFSRRDEVTLILGQFRDFLQKEQETQHLDLMLMLFTDVMGDGSVFLYYGPLSGVMTDLIETNFSEHYGFDQNIISRKQQLVPRLSAMLKNL